MTFVPGGFEEATLTSHKEYRVFLKNRKGFIKYALKFNYKVHPVFVFNENKCYKTSDFLLSFRVWLNSFKLPSAIFYSKYGIIPNPYLNIVIVIGKPIILPYIPKPKKEEVTFYHNLYMEELKKLF